MWMMNPTIRPLKDLAAMAIAGERTICKCCGGLAQPFGQVDFQKNCEEQKGFFLPPSGILVPYFRCDGCGFLFTRFFDHWSSEEFQVHIYNEAYEAVDPEYAAKRPEDWALYIATLFRAYLPGMSALDWGGGTGRLAELLRASGIQRAETWDPFNPTYTTPQAGPFNFVSCIEVLEHLPDPKAGIRSLISHLPGEGAILLSTLIQPETMAEIGTKWWYLAPRNGHISLHTAKSLQALFAVQGFHFITVAPNIHWAWRTIPPYLQVDGPANTQVPRL